MHKGFIALGLALLGIFFLASRPPARSEIEEIRAASTTAAKSAVLTRLLDRVGAEEAQEDLYRAGFPFTGETHLLVHTIGNWVYEKYGPAGLSYCKDYFLSACYHAFILNDLADHGLDGMTEVMEKCREAGPGVLPQCAHGAGHGFVAWHDYDLLKALAMCDELGTKSANFPYYNCYDGVFMENFWGVHSGSPSPKRWVKDDDIYYPCTDPRIAAKYLAACWGNQATSIYQHFKGDLRKTAEACDAVPNEQYKNSCYDNFARQINPITKGDVGRVFSLCGFATGAARQDECALSNMTAFWSVGDRETPFGVCAAIPARAKEGCYRRLASLIGYYYGAKPAEAKAYCAKIPETYRRLSSCET
jgi:hypothetical protein